MDIVQTIDRDNESLHIQIKNQFLASLTIQRKAIRCDICRIFNMIPFTEIYQSDRHFFELVKSK